VIVQYATDFSTREEIAAALRFWKGKGCHVNAFSTHTFAGNCAHKESPIIDGPLAGCGVTWGGDAGLPFYQMVIQPQGDVSLCCMDLLASVTLGNVLEDGIAGVWNSRAFTALIDKLYCGDALPPDFLCRKCSARRQRRA
jgi:MoaA/NifB/PqqE/SkfB family radical SAM enzyme